MHIINNETLLTIVQNPNIGQLSTNMTSIPIENSINCINDSLRTKFTGNPFKKLLLNI